MARTRNLKPSFFLNERLAELPPLTRILFEGLWCHADREGRLEDRPKKIKAELLPYDDHDVDQALNTLQAAGFILRYRNCEASYIQVLAFTKHQNPHVNEAASTIPAPDKNSSSTGQAPGKPDPPLTRGEVGQGPRRGRSGKLSSTDRKPSKKDDLEHLDPKDDQYESARKSLKVAEPSSSTGQAPGKNSSSPASNGIPSPNHGIPSPNLLPDAGILKSNIPLSCAELCANGAQTPAPKSEMVLLKTCKKGEEWEVPEVKIAEWKESYPDVNVRQTLCEIKQWLRDNPTKRKTSRGMVRFIGGWMLREQNKPDGT